MTATNMIVTINGGATTQGGAPLQEQPFSALIGFGDSNTDTGYFLTHNISNNSARQGLYNNAVAAGGGRPTDPGALMNTEVLAQDLGLTAVPVGKPGGTNYAASGATVSGQHLNNSLAPDIVDQIASYLSGSGNAADPHALYYISGGSNSATVAQQLYTPVADQEAYMVAQAHSMANSIEQLYGAGAKYILLDDSAGGGALGTTYNATLWADLSAANVEFTVSDVRNLFKNINLHPSDYGITNTQLPPGGPFSAGNPYNPADGGSTLNPSPNSVANGWSTYATQDVSPGAGNTYLWADNEHLSAKGQQIEGAYAFNVVQNAHPTVLQVLRATPLVVNEGTVSGSELSYQWQRESSGSTSWTDIAGATGRTYTVSDADLGAHVRVESFYHGTNGHSASSVSPETASVVANVAAGHFGAFAHDGHSAGGEVYALYDGLLGRAPDSLGLENWAAQLQAAVAPSTLAAGFLGSPEGEARSGSTSNRDFVEQLYDTALHRSAEPNGLQFWTDKLDHGTSRADVGLGIVLSDEHLLDIKPALDAGVFVPDQAACDVARIYHAVLARDPDAGGLDNWTGALKAGTPLDALMNSFLTQPEAQAKTGGLSNSDYVDTLYEQALGRHAEPDGLAYWTDQMDHHGASRASVTVGIAESQEAHLHLMPLIESGWQLA